jgi:predicted outer membrane protein
MPILAAVDPNREAVERADAILRATQEPVIDDPTVFVKGAALGALTLIELAKLSAARSGNPQIHALAENIRKDQTALRMELAAVAGRKRLDVPSAMIYEDEQMVDEGKDKTGAELDTWFLDRSITEHWKALALFEAAEKMKDLQLAAFAKKMRPMLEEDRKRISLLRAH